MSKRDYYDTLNISKSASFEEIKKSYRKLAMEFHPDRNSGNATAEIKFKEINEAYEVLKDDQKRAAYDRYGHAAFENGGGGAGGFDFGGFADIFSDIFSDFMGGGRGKAHSYEQNGDSLRYDLTITLEEAYSGIETEISYPNTKICQKCNGHGTADGKEAPVCETCKGRGRVHRQHGFMVMETVCPHCKGSGRKPQKECPECRGEGTIPYNSEIKVKIPAGVDEGTRIRVPGAGTAGVRGGIEGDLYVFVHVKEHKLYTRQGSDLFVQIPVSMTCAVLGSEMQIPGIDGHTIDIKVPAGTQYGQRVKIKGEGMPKLNSSDAGNLWVEFKVETPVKLSERQKELMEEFKSLSKEHNCHPEEKSFFDKVKDLFKNAS